MTLTEARLVAGDSLEHQQVTVDGMVALLLEDIETLQRQRQRPHLFSGNGACSRRIVIFPEGPIPKEFKGCVISHLRGMFELDDATLRQAMAELRRRHYHVHILEQHQYNVREVEVPYLVYQVDLLESSADSR